MVGAIKRFLGIDVLERENLTLAKALKAAHRRIGELQSRMDDLAGRQDRLAAQIANDIEDLKHELTAEAEKQKIIAKPSAPKRVNWRQAREALENRDSPEEV